MVESDVIVEPMHRMLAASSPQRNRSAMVEFTSDERMGLVREHAMVNIGYVEIIRDDEDDVAAARGIGAAIIISTLFFAMVVLGVMAS